MGALEDYGENIAKYILANPVRAGLVTSVADYPFWGSGVWSRAELIETLFDRVDSGREG